MTTSKLLSRKGNRTAEPATLSPPLSKPKAGRLLSRLTTRQSQPRLAAQPCTVLPSAPSPAPTSRIERQRQSASPSNLGRSFLKGSAKSKKRFTRPSERKNSATSATGRSESKYSSCVVRQLKNMLLLYGIHDRYTSQSPSPARLV